MQNRAEYLDMSRAYDASGLEEKTVSKGDARTRVTYGEIQLYEGPQEQPSTRVSWSRGHRILLAAGIPCVCYTRLELDHDTEIGMWTPPRASA